MQQKLDELTALCTSLQRQQSEMVSKFVAQEEGGGIAQSGDDAPIKGRSLDEGEEAAEKGSDDTEEMVTILTSLDAATVLSSEVAEVPTGSGSIPTPGPPATGVPTGSDVVPTASPIFTTATESTPYKRRKGKEKMVESDTPKKKKLQERIDVQRSYWKITRLEGSSASYQFFMDMLKHLDREDLNQLWRLVKESLSIRPATSDKEIELWVELKRLKPRSKKQKKDYYMVVIKSHASWKTKDFKGMSFEQIEANFNTVWKQIKDFIPMGSKEETERLKRKGLILEQECAKKLKTSEKVPEEVKSSEEVPEEKEDLDQLWAIVKETLNIRPATNDKKKELWVELKRLYEPDVKDLLWTHTQNLMHAPVE
nr:hypothetical protein [Tanacetum cinerariifolium]